MRDDARSVALLYHDVVENEDFDSSGFSGADANIYKLDEPLFRSHLEAVRSVNSRVLITVDDGGASSLSTIAPLLEEKRLYGYFFIATDWIGKPGFMTAAAIRELRARGHLIGSHSCSHPPRISHCSWEQICDEWKRSTDVLSDILFEPIPMASVPGGFYSRRVAEAAARAGIRTLFTSEPTAIPGRAAACTIVGRFMIQRSTTASAAAALARGNSLSCYRQALAWNGKKCLKLLGGPAWLRFRKWALDNGR